MITRKVLTEKYNKFLQPEYRIQDAIWQYHIKNFGDTGPTHLIIHPYLLQLLINKFPAMEIDYRFNQKIKYAGLNVITSYELDYDEILVC